MIDAFLKLPFRLSAQLSLFLGGGVGGGSGAARSSVESCNSPETDRTCKTPRLMLASLSHLVAVFPWLCSPVGSERLVAPHNGAHGTL